jgi:hypothetical protein
MALPRWACAKAAGFTPAVLTFSLARGGKIHGCRSGSSRRCVTFRLARSRLKVRTTGVKPDGIAGWFRLFVARQKVKYRRDERGGMQGPAQIFCHTLGFAAVERIARDKYSKRVIPAWLTLPFPRTVLPFASTSLRNGPHSHLAQNR